MHLLPESESILEKYKKEPVLLWVQTVTLARKRKMAPNKPETDKIDIPETSGALCPFHLRKFMGHLLEYGNG